MRKICLFLVIVVFICSMVACKSETVTLQCDGENCDNTVTVKVDGEDTPDDSWIIFCQECEENVLKRLNGRKFKNCI